MPQQARHARLLCPLAGTQQSYCRIKAYAAAAERQPDPLRLLAPKLSPVGFSRRWHPDIPPVATAKTGELLRVECLDWTGGQIKNNDSARSFRGER